MRRVNLHVEGVPNPNALKFVLENGIIVDEVYEFSRLEQSKFSPLARKLLMLRYVERVLFNKNYITVLKDKDSSPAWNDIIPDLRMIIQQHLEANEPILYIGVDAVMHQNSEDVVVSLVKEILDRHIRPAAQEDGGDIVFESYANGTLNLSMHGACHKCPYVMKTMKEGVEPLLTQMIPEVKSVTATQNGVL